jgi:hypothetical protein
MRMSVGAAAVGVCCFVLSVYLIVKKKAPKTSILLMLIAGFCALGLASRLAQWLVGTVLVLAGRGSVALFGAGAAAIALVAAVILVLELYFAVHPKKGKPKAGLHAPLAFLAPSVLGAAGGVFGVLAGGGSQMVNQLSAFLNGL